MDIGPPKKRGIYTVLLQDKFFFNTPGKWKYRRIN